MLASWWCNTPRLIPFLYAFDGFQTTPASFLVKRGANEGDEAPLTAGPGRPSHVVNKRARAG
jgi:hypothetical protein